MPVSRGWGVRLVWQKFFAFSEHFCDFIFIFTELIESFEYAVW